MKFLIIEIKELEQILKTIPKLESYNILPYKTKKNIDGEDILVQVLLIYKEK